MSTAKHTPKPFLRDVATIDPLAIDELKREWPKGCAPPVGYVQWSDWAEAQTLHGLNQKWCKWCERFFFPQEKPSHLRCSPGSARRAQKLTKNEKSEMKS